MIEKCETIRDLADCYPTQYMFYPTEEVMLQIVSRSTKLQNTEELWDGFHPVDRKDGVTWHQDELL